MTARRSLALGLTLAAVLVGGWKSLIPGLDLASSHAGAGDGLAVASAFAPAAGALQTYYATAGTYAGAELSPTSPVQLAWASDSAFCLQGGAGTGELHLVGPAAVPQSGPCPAA